MSTIDIKNGKNGLVNIGNTCFINSSIQCLHFTYDLTYYLFKTYENKNTTKNTLAVQWLSLLKTLWEGNNYIVPHKFLHYIYENSYFVRGEQNDCVEFIRYFLDTLNSDIGTEYILTIENQKLIEYINTDTCKNDNVVNDYMKIYKRSFDNWNKNFNNKISIVSTLFYGQTITQVLCDNCKKITHNFEVFNDIIVSIDREDKTIYDSLNRYFNREVLNTTTDNIWKCDKCNTCSESKKVTYIWKAPTILIICLKRYDREFRKLNYLIDFPITTLDMFKYCKGFTHKSMKKPIYNLYSVINHYGNYFGGHYNAYCNHPDKNWYECDDNSIKKIDTENIVSQHSYCLFYKLDENVL